MSNRNITSTFDISQLEAELEREVTSWDWGAVFHFLVLPIIALVLVALVILSVIFPVVHIHNDAMVPSLNSGEQIITVRRTTVAAGDIVVLKDRPADVSNAASVWLGGDLQVVRVIAVPGQWVNMDQRGNLFVNSVPLEEPYLAEKVRGDCSIHLPFHVPEGQYFVLNDNRSLSNDSRSAAFGCVTQEQLLGVPAFHLWPLYRFGRLSNESK